MTPPPSPPCSCALQCRRMYLPCMELKRPTEPNLHLQQCMLLARCLLGACQQNWSRAFNCRKGGWKQCMHRGQSRAARKQHFNTGGWIGRGSCGSGEATKRIQSAEEGA